MKQGKKKIAIMAGGFSSERGISLLSAAQVAQHLGDLYHTFLIDVSESNWIYTQGEKKYEVNKTDFTLDLNGQTIVFDLAFIAIHGTPGEDGKLQGYFDMLGIKYSTSNVLASSLSFNKGVCNDYLKMHQVKCAQSIQLFKGIAYNEQQIIDTLKLPLFVKPNQAGSSFGVSKVKTPADLGPAIENAFKFDHQVLLESFLEGREVTCGVHNFDEELTAMPVTEIITTHEFFDYQAKYEGASKEITPAEISQALTTKVQNAAKRIYQLLNLNGVARVDFILMNDEPYMIEANTVPGLSSESLIPQQARAMGFTLSEFFTQWVEHGLKS